MTKLEELMFKQRKIEKELNPLLLKDTLTKEEVRKYDLLMLDFEKIEDEIKRETNTERFNSNYLNFNTMSDQRDLQRFSMGKFIREAADGVLTGFEAEMHQEGKKEIMFVSPEGPKGFCIPSRVLQSFSSRSNTGQNAGTAGDGGNLLTQEPMRYFDALRNALVLPSLGATFLTGLTGLVPIVKGGLFSSQWLEEGAAVTVSKEAVGRVLMQAKRLSAYAAFSKQLLKQTSPGIDQMIQNSLIYANAEAIQAAAINGLAINNQPVGILNNTDVSVVAGGANGLAPAFSHMLDLESAVASNNADIGTMGYLTNAKVRGKLKATLKASNVSGYVWEGSEVNGYKAAVTNSVPSNLTKGSTTGVEACSAIIFGDWSKLIIGTWGGLDIVVDNFTLAAQSEVRYIINTYADVQVVNAKSFAVMKDALTA